MSKRCRILLVDDDLGVLQAYSRFLSGAGYAVQTAATGEQALRSFRDQPPDLVLLDVVLPDVSGTEVCRRIKADGPLDIPVILISGQAIDTEQKAGGLSAGADDYLAKPVGSDELLARIQTLLRLRTTAAALRASEERFRELAENIREVFWMTNPAKSEMLYISPGYEEIWGRTCESLYASPRNWLEAIHPDDRQRVLGAALQKQALGEYDEVYRIVRPDGSQRWIHDRAFPVRNEAGEVCRIVGLADDITARRRVEEQAHLLADAVQSSQELISITDTENRFTFVNQAFLNAYGYQAAEVLGQTPGFLLSPHNAPGLCDEIRERTLLGGWKGELLNRRKDGSEFPISLSTTQIKDQSGAILGLMGVARDISERRRAEKQRTAFSQLAHRLSGASAPEAAAAVIMETAADLFGWDAGYVHLYSEKEDKIIPVLTMDTLRGQCTSVSPTSFSPQPSPLMRLVMKEGARLVHREPDSPPGVELVPFGHTSRPSACMMYVPIRWQQVVVGVLSVQSYTPRAYSAADLKIFQTLADQCGNAIRRLEMAEALAKAEADYRGIFEHASEGIFRSTPDGRILAANPALARMFGYASPEEMMRSVTDLAHQLYVQPERREDLKRLLEAQDSVMGFEAENYRKDGSRFWISLNLHVVRDVTGKVLWYEGTNQDITDAKRAQEKVRELLHLLDQSRDALIVRDLDGVIQYFNQGAESLLGWKAAEVQGRIAAELLGLDAVQREAERKQLLQSGEWLGELELATKARQARVVQARCALARASDGRTTHVVCTLRDITAQKRAEEELRGASRRIIEAQEAERLRVARELHDCISQTIATARMSLSKVADLLGESPAAATILGRCDRLLAQALEDNRRIAHNLRPRELDEFGLTVACRELCKALRRRARLQVKYQIAEIGRPLAPLTELNLFRIAQEAMANVENHARAKTVWLGIYLKNDSLVLRVRDDGRGFAPGTGRKRKTKGHGLGLANIRERAAALGASCEVASVPKKGTTITVRVPIKKAV